MGTQASSFALGDGEADPGCVVFREPRRRAADPSKCRTGSCSRSVERQCSSSDSQVPPRSALERIGMARRVKCSCRPTSQNGARRVKVHCATTFARRRGPGGAEGGRGGTASGAQREHGGAQGGRSGRTSPGECRVRHAPGGRNSRRAGGEAQSQASVCDRDRALSGCALLRLGCAVLSRHRSCGGDRRLGQLEGHASISAEVLSRYAADAALAVDGVRGLVDRALPYRRGVKLDEEGGHVTVELRLAVEWGASDSGNRQRSAATRARVPQADGRRRRGACRRRGRRGRLMAAHLSG